MTKDNRHDTGLVKPPDGGQADVSLAGFRQGEVVDLPWFIQPELLPALSWMPIPILRIFLRAGSSRSRQFVVITQTCDIVRPVQMRPYLQLALLIKVDDAGTAKRYTEGETPQFVAVPNVGADAFANVDLIKTVAKRFIAICPHRPGVTADPEEVRRFGQAVARKFGRYPFPDYFVDSIEPLRRRILRRWDKSSSPEGKILADLVQIRVSPVPIDPPSDTEFTITFIVKQGVLPILADPPEPSQAIISWLASPRQASAIADKLADVRLSLDDRSHLYSELAQSWADLCVLSDNVHAVTGEFVSEDEYVLSDYWQSERLDLDQLSGPVTSG